MIIKHVQERERNLIFYFIYFEEPGSTLNVWDSEYLIMLAYWDDYIYHL